RRDRRVWLPPDERRRGQALGKRSMSAELISRSDADLAERARALYDSQLRDVRRETDRLFAVLRALQWFFGVGAALWISPAIWEGSESRTHPHVWAALFLGGAITSLPMALAFLRPGAASTRYVIAVAQMLWSGLLIHLTGGRIETHFHVFGSL